MRYLFFLIIIFFYCCHLGQERVVIKNETGSIIDILSVESAFDKLVFTEILPNESRSGYLVFKNTPKWDGDYSLSVWGEELKGKKIEGTHRFGYYTNGGPGYSKIITIKRDTFEVKEII